MSMILFYIKNKIVHSNFDLCDVMIPMPRVLISQSQQSECLLKRFNRQSFIITEHLLFVCEPLKPTPHDKTTEVPLLDNIVDSVLH